MEYRKEDEKETISEQTGMDVGPVGEANESHPITDPVVQQADEEPPIINISSKPNLISRLRGMSITTKMALISLLFLVLVLASVGVHQSHVKKSWVSFLRTEMMLYRMSPAELEEMADCFEQDRKDQGLSRKEYMSIMRAGMRSGYFDY